MGFIGAAKVVIRSELKRKQQSCHSKGEMKKGIG